MHLSRVWNFFKEFSHLRWPHKGLVSLIGLLGFAQIASAVVDDSSVSRTGLKLWLRADSLALTNGAAVNQWPDQSGGANDATQATPANQPTYVANVINGLPVVRFSNASASYLTVPSAAATSDYQSIFVVVKLNSTGSGSNGEILSKYASGLFGGGSGYNLGMGTGFDGVSTASYNVNSFAYTVFNPVSAEVFNVIEAHYPGLSTSYSIVVNGVEHMSAAALGNPPVPIAAIARDLQIGGGPSSSGSMPLPIGGLDIAEIIVYDSCVSVATRQGVEAYFNAKYGIGARLTFAAPTISIPTGSYNGAQTVTISELSGLGATIYYTLDGSTPTTSSAVYSAPLVVVSTTTINAIVAKNGYNTSSVAASSILIYDLNSYVSSSGRVLWLKADDIGVADGAKITQWTDASSFANNALQTTVANQPILKKNILNGHAVVRFETGQHEYLSIADNASLDGDQASIFVITQRNNGSGVAVVGEKYVPSTSGLSLQMSNATTCKMMFNGSSLTAATGGFGLLSGIYDRSSANLYINGQLGASTALTAALANNANPFYVGGRAAASSFEGDIAEIIVYNRGLSAEERLNIEAYANLKYGINSKPVLSSPVFSLQTGTYTKAQQVTISGPAGATIKYTLNGGAVQVYPAPQANTAPMAIPVAATTTIQAYAEKSGFVASPTSSATITIDSSTDYVSRDSLQLWLRAASVQQANGSAVSNWTDQSGHGNDAVQATSANQPIVIASDAGAGSKQVLQFASTDYLSVTDFGTLSPNKVSVFAIAKRDAAGSGSAMIVDKGSDTSGYNLRYNGGTNLVKGYINGSSVQGSATAGSYQTMCQTYDLANQTLFINGAQADTTGYSTDIKLNGNPITVGGRGTGSSLKGEIAEVMVYGRALEAWERKELEAYAFSRYSAGTMPTAEAPTFSRQDAVYADTQTVSINGSPGTTIYYTISPSAPDSPPNPATASGWQTYSSPLTISATTKVRAMATKPLHLNSPQAATMVIIDPLTKDLPKDGLKLWLRADTLRFNNGDHVWRWTDSSGLGNDLAQGDDPSCPTYMASSLNGLPALHFPGTGKAFMQEVNNDQFNFNAFTVVGVINRSATDTSAGYLLNRFDGTGGYGIQSQSRTKAGLTIMAWDTSIFPYASKHLTVSADRVSSPANLIIASFDGGATGSVAVDAAVQAQKVYDTPIVATTGALLLGKGGEGGTTIWYTGDISEVMIFNRVLSAAETKKIQAYVYARYAVASAPIAGYPTFNPSMGTYAKAQNVTINSEEGGVIHYELGGALPTPSSPVFNANSPIPIATTTDIIAIDIKDGYLGYPAGTPFGWARITIDPSTADVPRDGLKVWLRADSLGLSANAAVANWWDQSGSSNHASQGVAANCPTFVPTGLNGKPTVKFSSGAQSSMRIGQNDSLRLTQCSIVALVKRATGTNTAAIVSKGNTLSNRGYVLGMTNLTTAQSSINANSVVGTLPSSPQPVFNLLMSTYDQSYNNLWINGVLAASTSLVGSITDFSIDVTIGTGSAGGYFDGEIAELFIYDHALGDAERAGLQNYIYRKYGVGPVATLSKPQFSLEDGTYALQQSLTITSAEGATIRYTLDGSTPTGSSPLYSQPLILGATTTVKTIAMTSGYLSSPVAILKFSYAPGGVQGLPTDDGTPAAQQTDSDHDGVPDAVEIAIGSDPNDPNQTGGGQARTYQYDALHQLKDDGERTYNYDREGNASSAPKP